jgi:hypothetical protein
MGYGKWLSLHEDVKRGDEMDGMYGGYVLEVKNARVNMQHIIHQ